MKKDIFVVGAIIVNKGRILCAQRGPLKALPYKWEFPGGKIEEEETPQEALQREIKEEMKCEIMVGKMVEQTIYEYDFGTVHLTTFYCKLINGVPKLTEHVSLQWLPPENLTSLDWAQADIPAVKKIVSDLT